MFMDVITHPAPFHLCYLSLVFVNLVFWFITCVFFFCFCCFCYCIYKYGQYACVINVVCVRCRPAVPPASLGAWSFECLNCFSSDGYLCCFSPFYVYIFLFVHKNPQLIVSARVVSAAALVSRVVWRWDTNWPRVSWSIFLPFVGVLIYGKKIRPLAQSNILSTTKLVLPNAPIADGSELLSSRCSCLRFVYAARIAQIVRKSQTIPTLISSIYVLYMPYCWGNNEPLILSNLEWFEIMH